jgi:hypothetical protein
MEIGMLWFDDGPHALKDKVRKAVAFYTEKYGRKPTLCLVNPETLNGGDGVLAGVEVRDAPMVMRDHFWVGVDDKPQRNTRARRKAA